MQKVYLRITLIIVLLSLILVPSGNGVKAQTPPPLTSSIQIQNLDSLNSVPIKITYYNMDGTLATLETGFTNPVELPIPAGSSITVLPIHATTGFKGSAIVSSTAPIAIISNLTAEAANRGLGTYVGTATGGNVLFFPLIDRRKNISNFSIQNTEGVDVSVTIDFVPADASFADITNIVVSIKPGAAVMYDMAALTPNQWLGSIKVTGSGRIVGVVASLNTIVADSPALAAYNGFAGGSTTSVLPLVMEANNNNRTGTSCQNLGPNPATITMSYKPAAGFPARANDVYTNVAPNAIAVKVFPDVGGTRWIGSSVATIDNGSNLVCVVNQTKNANRNSGIYEGFDLSSATSKIVLPLVMSNNGSVPKTYTAFSVASADGTNINVTCDWKPSPSFADIADTTLGGAATLIFNQQIGFSPSESRWIGSAECTETGGKGIFAIVNQSRFGLPVGYQRDVASAYDGFNLKPLP